MNTGGALTDAVAYFSVGLAYLAAAVFMLGLLRRLYVFVRAPVPLKITLEGGEILVRQVPVEHWLSGATKAEVTVPGRAIRVDIDPDFTFPDVDRSNNVWPR